MSIFSNKSLVKSRRINTPALKASRAQGSPAERLLAFFQLRGNCILFNREELQTFQSDKDVCVEDTTCKEDQFGVAVK